MSCSRAPLEWQTLDVEFRAPRFDAAGRKIARARATVRLNGVELYDVDTRELPLADPPFEKRAKTGFIGLQRHGGASEKDKSWVRYRNLFVRPL